MNKIRRKELAEIREQLEVAIEMLEAVQSEEEEYRDNMPENLQGSEKYEKADSAVDSIANAIDQITDAISSIEEAEA